MFGSHETRCYFKIRLLKITLWGKEHIIPQPERPSKKECSDFLMGEASELLHSRLGIEDPELVILNVNLKSREGCTESVRFDKCTHGPSLPANKKPRKWFFYLL